MQYEALVEKVQQKGALDSPGEAERAIRATLSTLGECLYRTERRHLASQLPKEAKSFLYEYADMEVTRRRAVSFSLEEFYNRVGARIDLTFTHAVKRAKAVVAVLHETLPEGEWAHIMDELPSEYGQLLADESPEPGTPSPV